jgi:hypothetical protein
MGGGINRLHGYFQLREIQKSSTPARAASGAKRSCRRRFGASVWTIVRFPTRNYKPTRLGDNWGSRCKGAVAFCYNMGPGSLKIAKFPVKFPDGREFARRRARSALRRQPAIAVLRAVVSGACRRPTNRGLLRMSLQSPSLNLHVCNRASAASCRSEGGALLSRGFWN